MSVIKDGSNAIISYAYSEEGEKIEVSENYIGDTLFWDSFISPDTGNTVGIIYQGESIDSKMNELFELAAQMGETMTWFESRSGGKLDIKTRLPGHDGKSYHGFLYKGTYVSLRKQEIFLPV
jgi:filamentous hemagglutinin